VRRKGTEHVWGIKELRTVIDVFNIGIILNSMRIVEMESIVEMV